MTSEQKTNLRALFLPFRTIIGWFAPDEYRFTGSDLEKLLQDIDKLSVEAYISLQEQELTKALLATEGRYQSMQDRAQAILKELKGK